MIVNLIDPALTADSFNAVTISNPIGSNGSTVFEVGPHTIDALILQNGNLNVTSDLTVTQVMSWTGGSLSAYFNSPAQFTLASTAVMTINPGGVYLYLPLINDGTITWQGPYSLTAGPKGSLTNHGTLNINTTPASQVTLGTSNVPFTNTGTLRVNALNNVNVDYDFFNYGQVEINSGALNMTLEQLHSAGGPHPLSRGQPRGRAQVLQPRQLSDLSVWRGAQRIGHHHRRHRESRRHGHVDGPAHRHATITCKASPARCK